MRVDLPDGQWVDLRDEILHGQNERLRRIVTRDDNPDIEAEFLAVYVTAWSLRGVAEVPSDIDARLPIIDQLPQRFVKPVATAAAKLWWEELKRADPNATAAS